MYDFVDFLRMLAVTVGQKLHLIHLLQLNLSQKKSRFKSSSWLSKTIVPIYNKSQL